MKRTFLTLMSQMSHIHIHSQLSFHACFKCGEQFRTYKLDTDCLMPDGTTQWHIEPQIYYLECDESRYGLFMNEDLFLHLVVPRAHKKEHVTPIADSSPGKNYHQTQQ